MQVRFTREQILQICRTFVLSFVGRASWSLLGTQDNLSHYSTSSLKGSLDREPKKYQNVDVIPFYCIKCNRCSRRCSGTTALEG